MRQDQTDVPLSTHANPALNGILQSVLGIVLRSAVTTTQSSPTFPRSVSKSRACVVQHSAVGYVTGGKFRELVNTATGPTAGMLNTHLILSPLSKSHKVSTDADKLEKHTRAKIDQHFQ